MRYTWMALAAGSVAAMTAPAMAATHIDYTLGADDGDFIAARLPSLADRQYVGTGSIQFLSTLTDGTYGLSDLASFALHLTLELKPTGSAPGFYATATYDFGLSDLLAFQIVYSGGVAVSATWTLAPVAYSQATGGINPAPASVDFTSNGGGLVSFYGWPDGTKTLIAQADSLEATFSNTTAVPEPASWTTLIVGFGGIGWAARRRVRTKVSFA